MKLKLADLKFDPEYAALYDIWRAAHGPWRVECRGYSSWDVVDSLGRIVASCRAEWLAHKIAELCPKEPE